MVKVGRSRGDGIRIEVKFDDGDEGTYSLPKDAAELRLAVATCTSALADETGISVLPNKNKRIKLEQDQVAQTQPSAELDAVRLPGSLNAYEQQRLENIRKNEQAAPPANTSRRRRRRRRRRASNTHAQTFSGNTHAGTSTEPAHAGPSSVLRLVVLIHGCRSCRSSCHPPNRHGCRSWPSCSSTHPRTLSRSTYLQRRLSGQPHSEG